MSTRDIILIAVIVVCVIAIVLLLFGNPFSGGPSRPAGAPKGVHVICGDPECGFEELEYDASARDPNWPKECPKCEKQKLNLVRKCPACGKFTPDAISGSQDTSVTCIHCGKKVLLEPPPPDEGHLIR